MKKYLTAFLFITYGLSSHAEKIGNLSFPEARKSADSIKLQKTANAKIEPKTGYANAKEAYMSEDKLLGGSGPASVNWIDDGKRFSYMENKDGNAEIRSYDPKTGKDLLVFSPAGINLPGSEKEFTYKSFQWTLDSKFILFQTNFRPIYRNTGTSDFYFYSIASKSLKLVARDAQTAAVSPDGSGVGYERDGNLFVFNFSSEKETQLTFDAKPSFYNGRFGWVYQEEFGLAQAWIWSPDSKYIAFWQSDERAVPIYQYTNYTGQHDVYTKIPYPKVGDSIPTVKIGVINLAAAQTKWMNVSLDGGYIPRLYWTAVSGTLAVIQLNRKQNYLKLSFYDGLTGEGRLIAEEHSKQWIDIVNFAGITHYFLFPENRKEFFWLSDRDGYNHIYRYDYNGKIINQVTSGKWEVSKIEAVDDKHQTIYYSGTEVSPLERHLYKIGYNGSAKTKLTEKPGVHKLNVAPDGGYFIDTYSNISTPTRVELLTANKKIVKVFEDNEQVRQYVSRHFYSPRELFSFVTADGQQLDGYLVKPNDFDPQKKYPVVLNIYGGPGSQFVYNEFETNTWEQYAAQKGYVVANVNCRGTNGRGRDFAKVIYRDIGKYQSYDFVETAKYLAGLSFIDPANMAIKGQSFGGFITSYTMLKYPGIFKVAIVGCPVTDWLLYDALYSERFMDIKADNEAGYKANTSAAMASNLKGKMLLIHAAYDENVHLQNTMHLIKAFIDAGKDVDFRIYPPGAHRMGYSDTSYGLLMAQYIDYMNKYLKGDFKEKETALISDAEK
jgi:dipeptidyl-peptidase-4